MALASSAFPLQRFMRAALVAAAAGMAIVAVGHPAPAMAQSFDDADDDNSRRGNVDMETFYRELAPYGRWFEHRRWGTVWRPSVADGWRPYTRGHWARSEEHGWIWVAEEEWGWAPFHYGRWVFDEDQEEWLWIPGTVWAPAWVMWREGEDQVGWAPLPPDAVWEPGSGLRYSAAVYDSPRYAPYWVFCRPQYMFEPGLWRHVAPRSRHAFFWRDTRPIVNHHRWDGRRIFHAGVDVRHIERFAGRPGPLVSVRLVDDPRRQGWRNIAQPNIVPVYRPRVGRPELPSGGGLDGRRDPGFRPRDPGNPGGGFWNRPGLPPMGSAGGRPQPGQPPSPPRDPRIGAPPRDVIPLPPPRDPRIGAPQRDFTPQPQPRPFVAPPQTQQPARIDPPRDVPRGAGGGGGQRDGGGRGGPGGGGAGGAIVRPVETQRPIAPQAQPQAPRAQPQPQQQPKVPPQPGQRPRTEPVEPRG